MSKPTTFASAFKRERRSRNDEKKVNLGKGMRLAVLSKCPTAEADEKTSNIFPKTFGGLKKVLTFAAAIRNDSTKFFENITYQQVVQET